MKYLMWTFACLLIVACGFLCADCSMGTTRYFECTISDHIYKAEWTEVTVTSDSEGRSSLVTTHHDAEFHIICSEIGGTGIFDCQEGPAVYESMTNGQPVTVCAQMGRWSKEAYFPRIDR